MSPLISHTEAYVKLDGARPTGDVTETMASPTRAETKARTREALLEAGLALFSEQGFDAPSLDAICERAGYTRGAFYVHFRDRDDFALAVMERILMAYLETIVETAEGADDLSRTIDRFVDAFLAVREGEGSPFLAVGTQHLQLLLEGCRRSEEIRARFVAIVQGAMTRLMQITRQGQRAGTVRDDVHAHAVAQVLVSLVLGVLALEQTGVPHDVAATRDAVRLLLSEQR